MKYKTIVVAIFFSGMLNSFHEAEYGVFIKVCNYIIVILLCNVPFQGSVGLTQGAGRTGNRLACLPRNYKHTCLQIARVLGAWEVMMTVFRAMSLAGFAAVALTLFTQDAWTLSNSDYERYKASSADFAKADQELNRVWSALKRNLPAGQYKEILEEQRNWLKDVYDSQANGYMLAALAPEAYALALQDRVDDLKRRFSGAMGNAPAHEPTLPSSQPLSTTVHNVATGTGNHNEGNLVAATPRATADGNQGQQGEQRQAVSTIKVTAEGSGTTRHEALRMAWNEAVRKGVGMYMASKTQAIDDTLIEEIATYSRGQIDSFKILSENKVEYGYDVRIEANIQKGVIDEVVRSSAEHQIGLGDTEIARLQVERDKGASQKKVLDINRDMFDFSKCLLYKSSLENKTVRGVKKLFVKHVIMIDIKKYEKAIQGIVDMLSKITENKSSLRYEGKEKRDINMLYDVLNGKSVKLDDNLNQQLLYESYDPFSTRKYEIINEWNNKYNFKNVLQLSPNKFEALFFVLSEDIDVSDYLNRYNIEFYYKIKGIVEDKSEPFFFVPGWMPVLVYKEKNHNRGKIIPMIYVERRNMYGMGRMILPLVVYLQEVDTSDISQLKDISAGYELRKID